VIARAEDRGLGLQTWEVTRHLPCSVLLVDVCDDTPKHPERFPGATRIQWRGRGLVNRQKVNDWLSTVDVVYTAETFYDPGFTNWARRNNTRTVCHLNPEFFVGGEPTKWWSATPWRSDSIDPSTEVVPFPVADRWTPEPIHDGPTRWLHVEGRRAGWDRNGTDSVIAALPLLDGPCVVTIASQNPDRIGLPRTKPGVEVRVVGHQENYWSIYEGHDMLVMPRRYGGLCLPVQEAMGAGLGVVMSDVSPNRFWPIIGVSASVQSIESMYAGQIPVYDVDPRALAATMNAVTPECRAKAQTDAREWAKAHSWAVQADQWMDRFAAL